MFTLAFEDMPEGEGKAHTLARLFQKGLPVPAGFVLRKEAHENFTRANHPPSQALQELVMPQDIAMDLRAAYDTLCYGREFLDLEPRVRDMMKAGRGQAYVAIRGTGFAMLNVRGLPRIQKAVRDVWAKAPGELVVQKMIDAEKTGVILPAQYSLVIECSWGQQLLPGNSDVFVVNGDRVESTIGEKEFHVVRDDLSEMTTRMRVISDKRAKATLDEKELQRLLALYKRLEETLGYKPALTFAFERGKPWILQVAQTGA